MATVRSSEHPTDTAHSISVRGSVRRREPYRCCIVAAHLHARLEALRVVDRLLVVKHALSFIVGGPGHLFLSLFDRIKEGLPLSFGEPTARVDLLLGEKHLFQISVMVRGGDHGPSFKGTLV